MYMTKWTFVKLSGTAIIMFLLPSQAKPGAVFFSARKAGSYNIKRKEEKKMKKRIIALILGCTMAAAMLAGCGGKDTAQGNAGTSGQAEEKEDASAQEEKDGAVYRVAIVQQMDHASLDEIRLAIEAELDAKAAEEGITIEYTEFNGQNDQTVLNQIGSQVVSDGYDCVIPIATLAAQCMQMATEESQIPVVFAAISDPVGAGVVDDLENPGGNVTGTSDYLDAGAILDMIFAQNPDAKTIGLLYNKSEDSSTVPIQEAKEYLDEKGVEYIEKTGTTTDEVRAALDSMLDQVDAVFTPTDNTVMAAELAIYENFIDAGVPHYTGADSFVRNGAFATCGVNYTDLGTQTADMALDILKGADISTYPVHVMEGGIVTVNTETAEALGIDYSCFNDMCTKLVEVSTTED